MRTAAILFCSNKVPQSDFYAVFKTHRGQGRSAGGVSRYDTQEETHIPRLKH